MLSNKSDEWSEEDEDSEGDLDIALVAASVMVLGAEEARLTRVERRKPSRRYLRCPQLLPNPRSNTPWQVLGFAEGWDNNSIPRPDTNSHGLPRIGARSLNAAGGLGLIYHFLTSAMSDTALQQIFVLILATVTRYCAFALSILLKTLRSLLESSIKWWDSREECQADNELILEWHPLLEGAIGSIDGLNIALAISDDCEIKNATYNGWLHGHFTSCALVFSPQDGFYLIADTAFPRGTNAIASRIQAPLKGGQRLPSNSLDHAALLVHDCELLSYHQTVEWGMRQLRSSYGRLRLSIDVNDPDGCGDLLETCIRSMNLRVERVGISEIRTVYMRCWQEAEDDNIWNDFENVLFGDLCRRNRVSHFHRIVVED
ncbi:hypothetical protein V8D89_005579 [Ganoderma adspersum]